MTGFFLARTAIAWSNEESSLQENIMSEFDVKDVVHIANQCFLDSPALIYFNGIIEVTNRHLESEVLDGDPAEAAREDYAFRNAVFFGCVGDLKGYFRSRSQDDDGNIYEVDPCEKMRSLQGTAVEDHELLKKISKDRIHTIAALTTGKDRKGSPVVELHWHPSITKQDAIGFLKVALAEIEDSKEEEKA